MNITEGSDGVLSKYVEESIPYEDDNGVTNYEKISLHSMLHQK